MICGEFSKWRVPLIFSDRFKISGNRINKVGVRSPVELGWHTAIILEVDDESSVSHSISGPDNIGHSAIWLAYRDVGAFAYRQGIMGGIGRFFRSAPEKYVYEEQTQSDSDGGVLKFLFPGGSFVFAPIGYRVSYWGYSILRDSRQVRLAAPTFWVGTIVGTIGFSGTVFWFGGGPAK